MKVKELMEILEKADPELDIIVEADHGQTLTKAVWAGEDNDVWLELEDEDLVNGLIIQAY